jgi:CheY-like chemotaxis protein
VVDDEADVADSFAALLERLGQDVEVAYAGEAAVQVALEQRPQVAFLDLSMPGMSGQELARRLRAHFPAEALTLIALTGHGGGTGAAQGGAFEHHLLKPADVGAVLKLLNAIAGEGKKRSS